MRIAVFDTETTGFPDRIRTARIVEIGAVVVDWEPGSALTIVGEFESLARPRRDQYRQPCHAEALRLTGLTPEAIDKAPPDHVVGQLLEEWLLELGPIDPAVAFNADFDFHGALLQNATWLRRWLKHNRIGPCLMLAAQDAMGVKDWPRLAEAAEHFAINPGEAHTALDDARAAAQLIPHVWPQRPPRDLSPEFAEWALYDGERAPLPRGVTP